MTITQLLLSVGFACLLVSCGGGSSASAVGMSSASQITLLSSTNSFASLSSSAMNSAKSSSVSSSSSIALSKPISLSYGSNSMQVGDLRLPSIDSEKKFPLVIIIHGGCWVTSYADYHFMDNFSQAITQLGYATWNIEYRALGTGGEWPIIFQDVNKAIDYARTIAQNYPVDTNKVAVIGHSAGGHLALWSASRKNLKSDSILYTENPLTIRGVLSLAGITNVTSYNSCGTLVNDVIGIPILPSSNNLMQRLLETSPLQMLPIQTKTILISGSTDGIVPSPMGNEYSTKAVELGDDSKHYILPGLGHFDLIDPNKTDWRLYTESLNNFFSD